MKFKLSGFLTNEDMQVLQKASIKKPKYKKIYAQRWNCIKCDYRWFYKTVRCPSCSSKDIGLKS